jgi:undecaprenyl-diphosphatase
MTILQAIILGMVQGFTEFMPISSSAHLIIVPWLFRWQDPGLDFDVALHMGTLVALLWIFGSDWVRYFRAGISSIQERKINGDPERRMAWLLVIGTIPGIIIGALAEAKIEELFHNPNPSNFKTTMIVLAIIISLLGILLFIAERVALHCRKLDQISVKDTIIIGLSQAAAIIPGVSRSGSTITAGLVRGLQRETAAKFSFLLSVPIILGASFKSTFSIYSDLATGGITQSDLLFFVIGFAVAAGSGYLCIKFLLRFLQTNSTDIFVYYRWLLTAVIIVVALMRG